MRTRELDRDMHWMANVWQLLCILGLLVTLFLMLPAVIISLRSEAPRPLWKALLGVALSYVWVIFLYWIGSKLI